MYMILHLMHCTNSAWSISFQQVKHSENRYSIIQAVIQAVPLANFTMSFQKKDGKEAISYLAALIICTAVFAKLLSSLIRAAYIHIVHSVR